MSSSLIIGIVGLGLLAVGWLYEAIKTIRAGKSNINSKFAVLYVVGSFLLVIYSLLLGDIIFLILNSLVTIFSLINLFYSFKN
jgi:lipid-A-disaccharide synthase-like uncharacterized protein